VGRCEGRGVAEIKERTRKQRGGNARKGADEMRSAVLIQGREQSSTRSLS
jgi:hypothetical protein